MLKELTTVEVKKVKTRQKLCQRAGQGSDSKTATALAPDREQDGCNHRSRSHRTDSTGSLTRTSHQFSSRGAEDAVRCGVFAG